MRVEEYNDLAELIGGLEATIDEAATALVAALLLPHIAEPPGPGNFRERAEAALERAEHLLKRAKERDS